VFSLSTWLLSIWCATQLKSDNSNEEVLEVGQKRGLKNIHSRAKPPPERDYLCWRFLGARGCRGAFVLVGSLLKKFLLKAGECGYICICTLCMRRQISLSKNVQNVCFRKYIYTSIKSSETTLQIAVRF